MRPCRLSHAVNAITRLNRAPWWTSSQFTRSFNSTCSPKDTFSIRPMRTVIPIYEAQARPNPGAKNIAVVGGGVTGLATAYNLRKTLPHARITLFEAKKKLGGWLDSEPVPVDDGEVLFEWGPRTLRNNKLGRYTAHLVGRTKAQLW